MSDLALLILFDAVVARFAAEVPVTDPPTVPVPNVFGSRRPSEQMRTAARIAWVPGNDQGGDLGALTSAQRPGRDPRPLATLAELATVYVEAYDITAPSSERAQYEATRLLFDAWWRAVHLAAHSRIGRVVAVSARWQNDRKVAQRGACIRVVIQVDAMIPDLPLTYAEPPVDAVVVSSLLETADEPETILPEGYVPPDDDDDEPEPDPDPEP